ncbi:DUF2064 domain-containing protein [Nocardia panacis]|uniref:DUF2064 domain-containing protein n=1 Tax=Nocardia panacis TaxID=2340916 RepID=A0A3A4K687_9NOCA|nr:TIGR04282 family arsenosugar biosynthesis glycosyltransferase [Nocardia panacis]RJO69980.1 DUF2064 domain-containing protein [Nocardia panacis]
MTTLLVLAKAPIPGFAKTRLTPPLSPNEAATVAAAALLDTLDAVRHTAADHRVLAWTGDLADACRADELSRSLADFALVPQRGRTFGERLANAHADAAAFGTPVLQIGMDTPQLTPEDLTTAADLLTDAADAVLGPAADGGWWALGLATPQPARALITVPMSTPNTGALTREALHTCGLHIHTLPTHRDVDTFSDAVLVAAQSTGRFTTTVSTLRTRHLALR